MSRASRTLMNDPHPTDAWSDDRTILCAKCEHLNPETLDRCEKCGADLFTDCPYCGHPNQRVAHRCAKCRHRLRRSWIRRAANPEDPPDTARGQGSHGRRRHHRSRWQKALLKGLQIVLLILAVLLVFGLIESLTSWKPPAFSK